MKIGRDLKVLAGFVRNFCLPRQLPIHALPRWLQSDGDMRKEGHRNLLAAVCKFLHAAYIALCIACWAILAGSQHSRTWVILTSRALPACMRADSQMSPRQDGHADRQATIGMPAGPSWNGFSWQSAILQSCGALLEQPALKGFFS